MKRTVLARRAPLRRRAWARSRTRRPSAYRRRSRDFEFMGWVKTLPCMLAGNVCQGVIEADHAGMRALGRKASDRTCIPLCTCHHAQRHGHTGYFRGFDSLAMRKWCDAAIEVTQRQWMTRCTELGGGG